MVMQMPERDRVNLIDAATAAPFTGLAVATLAKLALRRRREVASAAMNCCIDDWYGAGTCFTITDAVAFIGTLILFLRQRCPWRT